MSNIFYLYKGGNRMDREISIFDVAKTFLTFDEMTHKKLQKLCYYTQAWHLALFKEKLFKNNFEAWIHGPVCPELYREYKDHGWLKISRANKIPENINVEKLEFLEEIYNTYGEYTGDELEYLTHQELPWQRARAGLEEWEPSHEVISEEVMKEFYWNVYQKNQGD